MKELITIQSRLKAPKGQYNSFGKYKYRSAEDILEAVKPLLAETECVLTISDDIIQMPSGCVQTAGQSRFEETMRFYVKATATLTNKDGRTISTSAFAREDFDKKGMDGSQITGAASSYARKYALNGLFAIDDTKDADATNRHGKDAETTRGKADKPQPPQATEAPLAVPDIVRMQIAGAETKEQLTKIYNDYSGLHTNNEFMGALTRRKQEIKNLQSK